MRRLRSLTRLLAPNLGRKWLVAAAIAVLSASAALGLRETPGVGLALSLLDDVLYDAFYHARAVDDRTSGDVAMVVVDDASLRGLAAAGVAWPYPRDVWARLLEYLNDCGARVVVFDLLFETPSGYAGYRSADTGQAVADDTDFKVAIRNSQVPVVLAMMATPDGKPGPVFVKPAKGKATVGAVNLRTDKNVRSYEPTVYGQPSLAMRAVDAAGVAGKPWMMDGPFRLHYYGPHERPDGKRVFTYLSFAQVLKAAATTDANTVNDVGTAKNIGASRDREGAGSGEAGPPSGPSTRSANGTGPAKPDPAPSRSRLAPVSSATSPSGTGALAVSPALFKDKIVLVGATAVGTYDLKSSPLSGIYPGVEIHATAIENLLHDQYVRRATLWTQFAAAVAGAMMAAVLTLLPRQTGAKLAGAAAAVAISVGAALVAFVGREVNWLPLGGPLVALVLATIAAFAWSYYTEDRHRRAMVKAFAPYVSPQMAAEIERNPTRVRVSDRQVMTVMFTDIEGFTGLSERLADETLTKLLNHYFDEMSPLVFDQNGYLDKYIGDAIMSFWNAPLPQPDHARLACRTALALERRERAIQPELRRLGADRVATRIGINTGPMVVGDMGSRARFNYTVLGDSVNLGARLEGANKFYGSHILLSQSTADLVRGDFIVRKLDLLQVVGKSAPIAVYELLGERSDPAGGKPFGGGGFGDERPYEDADVATPDGGSAIGGAAQTAADEPVLLDRVARYESAWDRYRQQRWDDAEGELHALLEAHPADAPARKLLARVADLRADPPGPGWDGAYVAKGK